MAKKLASKTTKEILIESEIKERGLSKTDFSGNWKGRVYVLDAEKSLIAEKMEIEKNGEYAIRVR